MTTEQKFRSLKKQTENAGMQVKEQEGKLVVSRKKDSSYGKRSKTSKNRS